MIDRLFRDRDLRTPAIRAAFERVPREVFVPEDKVASAYADTPLAIPQGQTISAPSMIAIMLEEGGFRPGQSVLEIGTGSGYNAALLADLVGSEGVTTIERHPELAAWARENLERAGHGGVTIVVGDGTLGHPERAPYDRIIATAGAPRIPKSWKTQLAPGGRILAPIGPSTYHQTLAVLDKLADGSYVQREGVACAFVPLIGAEGWRG